MSRKIFIGMCLVFLAIYASGPAIASRFRIGDREGPVIYRQCYHETVYCLFHDEAIDGKPRIAHYQILYNRPFFYGFPRRPKSNAQRAEILQRHHQRHLEIYDRLAKENTKIEAAR